MVTIRKNLVGTVLVDGKDLFPGDKVPSGLRVDPSLLEDEQPELPLDPQSTAAAQSDDQSDQSDDQGASDAQAEQAAADDEQADQGPADESEEDDDDDILGVAQPAPAKRARRTRKAD